MQTKFLFTNLQKVINKQGNKLNYRYLIDFGFANKFSLVNRFPTFSCPFDVFLTHEHNSELREFWQIKRFFLNLLKSA